jgi:hypothetical protein
MSEDRLKKLNLYCKNLKPRLEDNHDYRVVVNELCKKIDEINERLSDSYVKSMK